MILQLDDNYRIVSDEHNFILQKRTDPEKDPRKGRKAKEATDQWKNLGFWKDLSQLLASYTREVLRREIGKTTFKDLSRDLGFPGLSSQLPSLLAGLVASCPISPNINDCRYL